MIKLTLDTNCIINLLDFNAETPTSVDELSEIIRYAMDGDVNIAVTSRVETDLGKDPDLKRKVEMIRKLRMFPVIGSLFTIGTSIIGSKDVIPTEDNVKLAKEICLILFPGLSKDDKRYDNKSNDIDHLVAHIINKRNIFVTDDGVILRKSQQLNDGVGIRVYSPSNCLEYLDLRANKEILVKEFYEKILRVRNILIEVIREDYNQQLELEYKNIREWLLQKFPKIQDGLINFKLHTISIPMGGQRVFYQNDVEELHVTPRIIRSLYGQRGLRERVEKLCGRDSRLYYSTKEDKISRIEELYGNTMDLLMAYVGYLEKD